MPGSWRFVSCLQFWDWNYTPLNGLRWSRLGPSFNGLLTPLWHKIAILFNLLWSIWVGRNKFMFEGLKLNPQSTIISAMEHFSEFKISNTINHNFEPQIWCTPILLIDIKSGALPMKMQLKLMWMWRLFPRLGFPGLFSCMACHVWT